MKIKTIFVTIILGILLTSSKVYATENRITEEELQASSNIEATEVNRETAVMLLSATEGTATVIETWDISETEEDNVTATLYDNGNLIIEGTGNMKGLNPNTGELWNERRMDIKNVTIQEGVTNIGNCAFYNCRNLTSIIIPEGVTSIEYLSFYICSSLTSITIPDGVINIDFAAFAYCSGLTSIEIPDSVTTIEEGAFSHCSNLTSIKIPDGVTSIGDSAFEDCISLTSMTIPAGVTNIGDRTFYNCSSLTSINVDVNNKYYISDEGILFSKDKTQIICYPSKKVDIKSYDIPKTVKNIESGAFYGCSSLTSIKIPDGVTSIGDGTFYNCSSLTNIEIPEGVTSIGNRIFYDCSSLTSIKIPEGVTSIGDYTFYNCSSLTSIKIPDGVASIGDYTFYNCSSLTNIEIPDGVTRIGAYTFYGCSSLTSIKIPEGVTSVGNNAFSYCSSLTSIKIPDGVTRIGYSAFSGCSSLTSITIPDGVKSIESYTFKNCSSLTSINVYCNSYAEQYVTENYIDKLNVIHNYETVVTNPTCTERGYTTHTCTRCQNTYIDNEIEALGHTEVIDKAREATCTETGLTEGKHCAVCEKVLVEQKEVPALGHSFGEWTVTKNVTCIEDGIKEKICSVCGEKETEVIAKLGHHYESILTAPTCTERGYTTHTCTRCEDSYEDSYTEAKGHNFGEWTITKNATCTENGMKERICDTCGTKETAIVEELGHNYESVITNSTCTEKGHTTYTCTRCGYSYEEEIPALGHNFGEWIIDKEPTYEEEGHKYRICTNCNEEKQEEAIPKLTKEELQITTTYKLKEKDNIKHIILTPGTTVNKILRNIASNKEIKVIDKVGKELVGNALVGTGTKVVTKEDNKEIYTVVVKGDANGDGLVKPIDVTTANSIRLNKVKFSYEELLASDIDENEKVNPIDITKINSYRLGKINSL